MSKKSEWKKKVFLLQVPIYDQDIIVVINGQLKDGISFLEKMKNINKTGEITLAELKKNYMFEKDLVLNSGQARTYASLPHGFIVLLSHQEDFAKTSGVVAHECLHVVYHIMERVGINFFMNESDEAFTYLLGYLVENILKVMY